MGLFSFGKKKISADINEEPVLSGKYIAVLGSGCSKCQALEENVKSALSEMGIEEPVYHVRDFAKIAEYGVMTTPALVIDGEVAASGKVLSAEEANQILSEKRSK